MSKMGPQVERRFESRNVIVVKSTAQPSEIINILYDVRVSMHLISNLSCLIVSVGNGSRLRKYNLTFRQIPSGDSRPTNCQVVSYGCQDYNILC